jgi:hypothetical protein
MKNKFLMLAMLAVAAVNAQITEGFEKVQLDSGKVIDGSDGTKVHYFSNGEMSFPVSWDTTYKYWSSGWALSKVIYNKVEVSDYTKHLYAAAPGFGVENDKGKAFMVGQSGSGIKCNAQIFGFYVANSTYAYNSMKFGDFAGKKFGGAGGKDKDSFILKIEFFKNKKISANSRVVLADFRFDDSTKDFISNQWIPVMAPNSFIDSISFQLESSDNGQWGMNTPAFFALDGMSYTAVTAVKHNKNVDIQVFPVPANASAQIISDEDMLDLHVWNTAGQLVMSAPLNGKQYVLPTQMLKSGVYYLNIRTNSTIVNRKLQILH